MDAVSHNAHAVCFVGGCISNSAGCSIAAVVAEPTAVSLNMDGVPMQWMQYPIMCMQYVVMGDAVPMKVDSISLQ